MMNKLRRMIPVLLLVILCMATLGGKTFAHANPPEETTPVAEQTPTEGTVPPAETVPGVTVPGDTTAPEDAPADGHPGSGSPYDGPGLTPGGNMTLVDDIIDHPTGDMTAARQFLTLETKGGNVFFVIIDRTSDKENVYFLNLVDEADLMALMDEDINTPAPACSCKDKCVIGAIDTSCEVCRVNMSECAGKETGQEKPAEQEKPTESEKEPVSEKPSEEGKPSVVGAMLGLAALGAGCAVYFIKFRKSKAADTEGPDDLDEYEFGEEDEEEEVRLTKEEKRLISLYRSGTRQELIDTLRQMRSELTTDETMLLALTDSTVSKLERMTDSELDEQEIVPDFIKGVFM